MTRRAWNVVWATVIIGVPVALLVLPIRRSENATPTVRVTSAQIAFLRNTCHAVNRKLRLVAYFQRRVDRYQALSAAAYAKGKGLGPVEQFQLAEAGAELGQRAMSYLQRVGTEQRALTDVAGTYISKGSAITSLPDGYDRLKTAGLPMPGEMNLAVGTADSEIDCGHTTRR